MKKSISMTLVLMIGVLITVSYQNCGQNIKSISAQSSQTDSSGIDISDERQATIDGNLLKLSANSPTYLPSKQMDAHMVAPVLDNPSPEQCASPLTCTTTCADTPNGSSCTHTCACPNPIIVSNLSVSFLNGGYNEVSQFTQHSPMNIRLRGAIGTIWGCATLSGDTSCDHFPTNFIITGERGTTDVNGFRCSISLPFNCVRSSSASLPAGSYDFVFVDVNSQGAALSEVRRTITITPFSPHTNPSSISSFSVSPKRFCPSNYTGMQIEWNAPGYSYCRAVRTSGISLCMTTWELNNNVALNPQGSRGELICVPHPPFGTYPVTIECVDHLGRTEQATELIEYFDTCEN